MTPTKDAPPNFDPSDVYFQGWLLSRDADKLKAEKKYVEAYEKILRAQKLFDSVSKFFPLWKPEMVKGRVGQTTDFIASIGPEVVKANSEENGSIAEFEGGVRAGVVEGQAPKPLDTSLPEAPMPPAQPVETLETRRIAELENRVKELQADLSRGSNANSGDREAARSRDIAKQRDMAQAELKRANDELAKLRSKFAAEPMQEELQKLTDQLKDRDREKAALGQALNKSEGEVQALQAERVRLAQQVSDLTTNLADERRVQNEVIAGQQKQMRKMQEELRAKNDELARANDKITTLENDLATIRADFQGLKEERDGLVQERNQMAALLKLNEGSQITQLLEQTMGLDRQLREAKESVERLNRNHTATQEQLLEAMTDLSIAKRNINDFKREKVAQEKRIEELESRLRAESANLAANSTDPGEADMLRAIIQKQLRIQERRRKQSEILIETAKAQKDDKVREAAELFQASELALSPQEMDLLKTKGVDDEFVSPFRRPRDQVEASVAKLEGENLPYIDAATRAYVKGRYLSARELCEEVLDSNPGDTGTMCRLGTVHLQLKDPVAAAKVFSNAVVIDSNNPYAHRMLGYSRMQTGEYGEALESLKRSVELAPTNADGRVLLGALLFDLGQEEESEEQLKSAIIQDDAMWRPHFNLAILYAKQGKKKQGMEYYRSALERGAAPDLALEKKLAD